MTSPVSPASCPSTNSCISAEIASCRSVSSGSVTSKISPPSSQSKYTEQSFGNRLTSRSALGLGSSCLASVKSNPAASMFDIRKMATSSTSLPSDCMNNAASADFKLSSIRSLRGLGCTSHGRGQTGVVPTGNAPRRSGFKLPETIFEDMIAGMAFVIICLGVPFIVAMLT